MSQENVEIVSRFLDLAGEAPDAVWDSFAEEVTWEVLGLGLPDAAHVSRPRRCPRVFRRWVGVFDNWDYEVEEMIDGGDAVVVRIRQWGSGKGSGVAVENRFWQVWIMRDGRAVRVTHRTEKSDALKAAGLSE